MSSPSITGYMSPNPHTVGHGERLASAYELMSRHNVRHLPVLDRGRLVGIVSQRDLFLAEALRHRDPELEKVEEAMTSKPFTVPPTAAVADVARTMAENKFGAALVMDGDKLVGIFTANDALRAVVELLDARTQDKGQVERAKRTTQRQRPPL